MAIKLPKEKTNQFIEATDPKKGIGHETWGVVADFVRSVRGCLNADALRHTQSFDRIGAATTLPSVATPQLDSVEGSSHPKNNIEEAARWVAENDGCIVLPEDASPEEVFQAEGLVIR